MATLTMKVGLQNTIEGNLSWERNKLRVDGGLQVRSFYFFRRFIRILISRWDSSHR